MSLYWSLAVAIIGLLVYAFAKEAKASEVGRICFMVGLFVFMFKVLGSQIVTPFR